MLMYIYLPRLFYLELRSGRLTGNFGQSPQSWVCVTVDKEDNKTLHLFRGAYVSPREVSFDDGADASLRTASGFETCFDCK